MNGLSMKDEDGNYYGYDYDYLMQIAQYSGWEYEFVEVEGSTNEQLTTLMEMLKDGEIDLLGQTVYIEKLTEDYDYVSEPYGYAYNVLAVKNNSDIYDFDSLLQRKDLKVAILKSSGKRAELLDQFTSMNGITYEKVICENTEELLEKVDSGEVDAFLYVDLSVPENYHPIVKFSPTPFYFITTKGNYDVINELNRSLNQISESNPTLQSTLYERYFGTGLNEFELTKKEQEFVEDHPTLQVLVREGNAPIQYIDNNEVRGVGRDILDKISEKTGITFEYIIANSYEEYKEIVKEEKIDILLGIPYEMKVANDFNINLTNPYLRSNLVMVTNDTVNPNDLTKKVQAASKYSKEMYDHSTVIDYFDTAEDMIKSINTGKSDYAYLNNYLVTYYDNKYDMKNISTFSLPDYLQSQYAFGIAKSENLTLVSIMNKAIRSMDNDLDSFVYKNAYVDKEFNLVTFIQENILWVLLGILLILITVIHFIRSYYRQQLKMKRQVELEYKRFQLLSEISGEITFSYDYALDEMKVSNSGLGKLAKESILNSFSTLHQDNQMYQRLNDYLKEKEDVNEEVQMTLLDGEEFWYQITLKVIYDGDDHKQDALYAIGKVINIQQDVMTKELLLKNSQTDPLTSVLNRAGAQIHIDQAILETTTQGALLMIDLDHFKNVNDQFGHAAGDNVLKESVMLLKKEFDDGIIARMGGDEFVIYLKDTQKETVTKKCENVLKEIQNIPSMKENDIRITLSIGIALSSKDTNLTDLMKQADQALYQVKRNQRNDYCVYED